VVIGPEEDNQDGYYCDQTFKNARLDEGVQLEVDNVKVKLVPSK
jgi:hypothetical protein